MAIEVTNVPANGLYGQTRTPKTQLGKDDFLLLLTKQLQNQDPMKPMDNMEFVSQMANFTSLEQMTNMNKTMEKFLARQGETYKVEAMGLLGKSVTALPEGAEEPVAGVVSSVWFQNGEAIFKTGESEFKMSEVLKVESV